jgi:hypothetical protein
MVGLVGLGDLGEAMIDALPTGDTPGIDGSGELTTNLSLAGRIPTYG